MFSRRTGAVTFAVTPGDVESLRRLSEPRGLLEQLVQIPLGRVGQKVTV